MLLTILAARLCTASSDLSWVAVRLASQTAEAYSRVGLRSCLYALSRRWGSDDGIVLQMKPSLLDALDVTNDLFSFYRSEPSSVTLRYLTADVFGMVMLCRV